MRRGCVLAGMAAIGFLTSILAAKPGAIHTKDGRTLEGDITEPADKPDQVIVTIAGAQLTIQRSSISSIDYSGDITGQYKERLAQMGAHPSSQDHLNLAHWLFDRKAYDLSRTEAEAAQKLDPSGADAPLFLETIRRQAQLERNHVNPPAVGDNNPNPANPTTLPTLVGRNLLNASQIQVIRQNELRNDDTNVRVQFANNVQKRYMDYANLPAAEFVNLNDFSKAVTILQKGLPAMATDVKIMSDPAAIALYKSQVHGVILSNCATNGCHNETSKTSLVLFAGSENDIIYTDFFILTHYNKVVDRAKHYMIDRNHPEESLLLQYGLTKERSKFPHKDVPGYRPAFQTFSDPKYQQTLNWVTNVLIQTPQDYKIDYRPPSGAPPTTEPVAPAPAATTVPAP